tara:strand:- start:1535 stop:3373 length:1839 start_codon:yes stop_codon:yes gene_type:complete
MLKKLFISFLLFGSVILSFGQFGPGGVGNSTNNGIWLRADQFSGADGDPVATWEDQSGNGNDASRATLVEQPLYYSTSALNSQPIIRFDGSNDQMQIADANILDGSGGLTYFAVLRGNNIDGSPRGILGKRLTFTSSSNYAYTWFFHTGTRLHVDIETQNNRFNTTATFSNSTNYILGLRFDGTSPSSSRVGIWIGENLNISATESSTSINNSNQPVTLGALNEDYGTYLGADYAEIIQFNFAVNTAQRIIINNYLSAKYNIALTANDVYTNDNAANGNYDFDVAGIGRVDASNIQNDSKGSGPIRILNPTNLGNNEFMLWGHDGANSNAKNYIDIPTSVDARLERLWRINEVNTSGTAVNVGNVDVRWDLSTSGPVTASELRLLIDTDNDGTLADETPISGATALGGGIFEFSGVSGFTNGTRFTLATIDETSTPLPVTWSSFVGKNTLAGNELTWTTASEINNDYFSVERSNNATAWTAIGQVNGNGNSITRKVYSFVDREPIEKYNYYRIKQVDFNGAFDFSKTISILNRPKEAISIYPNPAKNQVTINHPEGSICLLFDLLGNELIVKRQRNSESTEMNTSSLKSGIYMIKIVENQSKRETIKKLIIE